MISYQQIAMLACPAVCGLAGGKGSHGCTDRLPDVPVRLRTAM